MRMEVNALDYAIEEVLFIEYNNRQWMLVEFLSNSLNEIERNCDIHNKEMLVVIRELENWIHLLESVKFKFKVWTDHKNLEYFMKVQNSNKTQVQWVLKLSRFDFTLKHILETKMRKADKLSRRADWKLGVENDNNNQILIKEQWIHNLLEVVIERPEIDIIEKIKIA